MPIMEQEIRRMDRQPDRLPVPELDISAEIDADITRQIDGDIQQEVDRQSYLALHAAASLDPDLYSQILQTKHQERQLYHPPEYKIDQMSDRLLEREAMSAGATLKSVTQMRKEGKLQDYVRDSRERRRPQKTEAVPRYREQILGGDLVRVNQMPENGPTIRAANALYLAELTGTDPKQAAVLYDGLVHTFFGDKDPKDIRPLTRLIRRWYSDQYMQFAGIDPAVYRIAGKFVAGEELDWQAITDNIPDDRVDELLAYISMQVTPENRGFYKKALDQMRRAENRTGRNLLRTGLMSNQMKKATDLALAIDEYEAETGLKPDHLMEIYDRWGELKRRKDSVKERMVNAAESADPIEGENVFSKATLMSLGILPDAAASVPMAMGGHPEAAAAYWYARVMPSVYDDLQDLGFDDDVSAMTATGVAIPIALINAIQAKQLVNLSPKAKQEAVKAARVGMARYWAKKGVQTGATMGVEWLEEGGEALVQVAGTAIAQAVSKHHPEIDWNEVVAGQLKGLQDAAWALPGLVLGGKMIEISSESRHIASIQKASGWTKPQARGAAAALQKGQRPVVLSEKAEYAWDQLQEHERQAILNWPDLEPEEQGMLAGRIEVLAAEGKQAEGIAVVEDVMTKNGVTGWKVEAVDVIEGAEPGTFRSGSTQITEDGMALVRVALGGDRVTGGHELMHVFDMILPSEDVEILRQAFPKEDGSYDREAAAAACGEYIDKHSGSAPQTRLQRVWHYVLEKLRSIRSALHRSGYRTAEHVFQDIMRGQYRGRKIDLSQDPGGVQNEIRRHGFSGEEAARITDTMAELEAAAEGKEAQLEADLAELDRQEALAKRAEVVGLDDMAAKLRQGKVPHKLAEAALAKAEVGAEITHRREHPTINREVFETREQDYKAAVRSELFKAATIQRAVKQEAEEKGISIREALEQTDDPWVHAARRELARLAAVKSNIMQHVDPGMADRWAGEVYDQILSQAKPVVGKAQELADAQARRRQMRVSYETRPLWHSKLERVINEKMQASMDVQQFANWIKKQGIKAEEMFWSGLDDVIETAEKGQKITKDQILGVIAQHRIIVEEVLLDKEAEDSLSWDDGESIEPDDLYIAEQADEGLERDLPVIVEEHKEQALAELRAGDDTLMNEYAIEWDIGDRLDIETESLFPDDFLPPNIKVEWDEQAIRDTIHDTKWEEYREKAYEAEMTNPEWRYVDSSGRFEIEGSRDTGWVLYDSDNGTTSYHEHLEDAQGQASALWAEVHPEGHGLQWEDYILSDQFYRNYRELLLRWPEPEEPFSIEEHWGPIENVIAHVRFDDRVDEHGDDVLFLEEIQSDWHQQGRDAGYKQRLSEKEVQGLKEQLHTFMNETVAPWIAAISKEAGLQPGFTIRQAHEHLFRLAGDARAEARRLDAQNNPALNEDAEAARTQAKRWDDLATQARWMYLRVLDLGRQVNSRESLGEVPDAPFKQTWPEMVLRRMFRWAADNGYKAIAWTTGDQQIERWSGHGTKDATVVEWFPEEKELVVTRRHRDVPETLATNVSKKALKAYLGKGLAADLLAQPLLEHGAHRLEADEGEVFQVGGQGMRFFYDAALTKIANKLAKKHGASVEEGYVQVDTRTRYQYEVLGEGDQEEGVVNILSDTGQVVETMRRGADGNFEMRPGERIRQLGMDISRPIFDVVHRLTFSDKMVQDFKESQPLFETKKKDQKIPLTPEQARRILQSRLSQGPDIPAPARPSAISTAVLDYQRKRLLRQDSIPAEADGSISAARSLYETRNWAEWSDRFRKNEVVQAHYGQEQIDDFLRGIKMTAKIFGDFRLLDEEDSTASPIRDNADPTYVRTFDLTTVCPQQDMYVAVIRELERRYDRILNQEERFLIGMMMNDAGYTPACWYCYGQAGRDAAGRAFSRAADIYNQVAVVYREGRTPTEEELKDAFGTWSHTGRLAKAVQQYHEQVPSVDAVRMRDIWVGDAEPESETEAALAEVFRSVVQGATKPNRAKGWAAYRQQILTMSQEWVDRFNLAGGLRMNSQSDFRPWYVIDTAQMLAHLGTKGGTAHVFTRIPQFVEIFGATGLKFNLSMEYARNPDGSIMRDENGDPVFNDMNGYPTQQAMADRRKHERDVGTMLVAMNDDEVQAGLDDERVDMIIPFHAGRVPQSVYDKQNAQNYEGQNEEDWTTVDPDAVAEYLGESLEELRRRFWVRNKVLVEKRDPETFKPQRYAFTITREHHDSSKAKYLALCERLNVTPRFERFVDHPNYMKLVNDVAKPNNQQAVDVTQINWDAAGRMLEDWVGRGGDIKKAPPALVKYIDGRIADEWYETRKTSEEGNENLAAQVAEYGRQLAIVSKQLRRLQAQYLEPLKDMSTKKRVRRVTGQTTISQLMTEEAALKASMKKAQQASKQAYREGKKQGVEETKAHHKELQARQREIKKYRQRLNRAIRRASRKIPKNVDFYYAEAIENLRAGIDLKMRSKKTLAKRMRTLDFLDRHPDRKDTVPQKLLRKLSKKPLNDYEIEEVEQIADEVERLIKLGQTKRGLKEGRRIKTESAERADLVEAALRGEELKTVEGAKVGPDAETTKQKVAEKLSLERAMTLRPNRLFDLLDGGNGRFDGPWHRMFIDEVNDAEDAKLRQVDERLAGLEMVMQHLGITNEMLVQERDVPGVPAEQGKWTLQRMIGVYVLSQNPRGREAIMYGNQLEEGIETVISRLSSREKALGDWIIENYEARWPQLREAMVSLLNDTPPHEERYSPIRRVEADFTPPEQQIVREVMHRQALKKGYAERGFSHARVKIPPEHQGAIDLDVVKLFRQQTAIQEHFIAFAELVARLQRAVNNKTVRKAVEQVHGKPIYKSVQSYVNRVANPQIYRNFGPLETTSRALRRNVATAYLALNVITMMKQLPSVALYLEAVGPQHLLSSALDFATNPKKMIEMAREKDPQLKHMAVEREIDEIVAMTQKTGRDTGKLRKLAMSPIRFFDSIARTIGWNAVYQKAIAEGASEAEAIRLARNATLRTQPAASPKDLPELYVQGEALNWALMFTNQPNQIWNMITYDLPKQVQSDPRQAVASFAGLVLSAAVIWMASNRRLPEDGEDLVDVGLAQFLASIPLVGSAILAKRQGWDRENPVFASPAEAIAAMLQGDWDRAARSGMETGAILTGTPYIGTKRFWKALAEGDPFEIIGGIREKE